jgi:hypothetical protein
MRYLQSAFFNGAKGEIYGNYVVDGVTEKVKFGVDVKG